MTTPNLNPDPNPNPDPSVIPLQSPIIPPTPIPTTTPIDPDSVALLRDTLREANNRAQRLENELAQVRTTPVAPATPRNIEAERAAFFDDPIGTMRTLVKDEMRATVDPLNDFVREVKGGTAIDRLVNQYKTDRRFAAKWNSSIESYVREQSASINPQQLEQLFGFVVTSGIGMYETGLLTQIAPIAPTPINPPTPPNPTMQPPQIPPSPALPELPARKSNVRELNEHERRLLNEFNRSHPNRQMTPEQYIALQELPAGEVATSRIGIPEKK